MALRGMQKAEEMKSSINRRVGMGDLRAGHARGHSDVSNGIDRPDPEHMHPRFRDDSSMPIENRAA